MINRFYRGEVNLDANYRHYNGDLEPVKVLDYDGKGKAWVRWNDKFVNMVYCDRLEIIKDE